MKTNVVLKVKVACLDVQGCGWSGGRKDGPYVRALPCYRCGGQVAIVDEYEEVRLMTACTACHRPRENSARAVGKPCLCGEGVLREVDLVFRDTGEYVSLAVDE